MEQKINIAEVLRDAPKGTKLYSPVCGECWLVEVKKHGVYPIVVATSDCADESEFPAFQSNGHYQNYFDGECLLFPSKNNRDWSTFSAPWMKDYQRVEPEKPDHKVFKPFEMVIVANYYKATDKEIWTAALYSHYDGNFHRTTSGLGYTDECILDYKDNDDKIGKEVEK